MKAADDHDSNVDLIFARPIAIAIEGPTYKHNLYAKCFLHVSCMLHIHKAFTLVVIKLQGRRIKIASDKA